MTTITDSIRKVGGSSVRICEGMDNWTSDNRGSTVFQSKLQLKASW